MSPDKHKEMVKFIWSICNLLRGPYKRNEYRKVILPLTVLRRFDCVLAPTKEKVLTRHNALKGKSENIIRPELCRITKTEFYNLSKLDFNRLLDDPNHIAQNLNSYINAFSPNVRQIMERFEFGQEVLKMAEKNLLYEVVKVFCSDKVDLSLENVDNMGMGYVFEELIRIGAEQSNEEAGEHFTPREVIELMVNLLLSPEEDLAKSHVVKKIYDPACGTGGMLSTADKYIRKHNAEAKPILYGQDWNDGAYAVCKSDMLINGSDAENIKLGCVFTQDGFEREKFDYMLANPPFGVEWKQQQRFIEKERDSLGYEGRFGAGIPRINDGALLFLQHMISKMNRPQEGSSRIAIVFNGSPLFTGDAGGGESEIRRWIIENDWLEAIVSLTEQLFYNTGISTYIWILTNRKEKKRKGKIQLIDAREFYLNMKKSLGNKRREIGNGEEGKPNHIANITKIYDEFKQNDKKKIKTADGVLKEIIVSKIFDNEDFYGNDMIIGRVGAKCGNVHLVEGKKWISDNALFLYNAKGFELQYLSLILRVLNLNQYANQNAQPLITGWIVRQQIVVLPSIKEQKVIADFLDHKTAQIDDLIQKKEEIINLLKEKRAAIINQAVTKGLDPNAKMKPSGIDWIGDIPEGWEVRRLKFIASTKFSNVDKHSKEEEQPVSLCNYVDVYYNDFIDSNMDFMQATATNDEIRKFALNKGDVIVTKDSESWDDIAIPAYIKEDMHGVLCGYHLAIIQANQNMCGEYIFWSFLSQTINYQFQVSATGVTRYGLGKGSLDNAMFFAPSKKEQHQIAKYLDQRTTEIDSLINKIESAITKLREYRSSLITAAVTGKIDVRE